MLHIKPVRKIVGFISLISALIWMVLSVVVILLTFQLFEPLEQDILTQHTQALNLLHGVETQIESLPDFFPTDGLNENIKQAKGLMTFFFNTLSGLLEAIRLISIFVPLLIIFSQIMPAILGLHLLRGMD